MYLKSYPSSSKINLGYTTVCDHIHIEPTDIKYHTDNTTSLYQKLDQKGSIVENVFVALCIAREMHRQWRQWRCPKNVVVKILKTIFKFNEMGEEKNPAPRALWEIKYYTYSIFVFLKRRSRSKHFRMEYNNTYY